MRLLTIGRPLIFDEFINMHDWLGQENNKLPKWLIKLADWYERSVLKTCQYILTDTKLGAASSSRTYDIPLSKYRPIYVGADESLFYPRTGSKKNSQLEVFFYGTLAPLHGVEHILDAARRLVGEPIHLTIIGGKGKPSESKSVTSYIKLNSLENVTYKEWVDFEKLPDMMAAADVFLGGPFGDTSQAKRVITGKTFQSLAVGKATVVGKINEAAGFKDKVNCLLVEQGSGQALQAALLWASRNRSKLPDLGKAGHQLYGQTFSSQSVADELKIILDSL
ncbi:MAG: glycosyltransferase [Candidatus Saccharimonadales bacterium]